MSGNDYRDGACAEAQEALLAHWVDGAGEALEAKAHLASCATCRGLAEEIDLIEAQLARGLDRLGSLVGTPPDERVEEIIRRIREEKLDSKFIRMVRRPVRILLWIAFYSFTLLAAFVLAAAVYRALR
jgi:hypothetical protein